MRYFKSLCSISGGELFPSNGNHSSVLGINNRWPSKFSRGIAVTFHLTHVSSIARYLPYFKFTGFSLWSTKTVLATCIVHFFLLAPFCADRKVQRKISDPGPYDRSELLSLLPMEHEMHPYLEYTQQHLSVSSRRPLMLQKLF